MSEDGPREDSIPTGGVSPCTYRDVRFMMPYPEESEPEQDYRKRFLYYYVNSKGGILGIDETAGHGQPVDWTSAPAQLYSCLKCGTELHYWQDMQEHIREPDSQYGWK